jgi:hypothetical protein
MSTNEKDLLIAEALEETVFAIRQLTHHTMHMDSFLMQNFRNYGSYGANVYGTLDSISLNIAKIRELSATNRQQAHRLEKDLEFDPTVGMDENGNYRRSEPTSYSEGLDTYLRER